MTQELTLNIEPKIIIEKIEDGITAGEKLTDEKIENSLNYELLSKKEKETIDKFCREIDVTDFEKVLVFGDYFQNNFLELSNNVLTNVNTPNISKVENLLTDLVNEIENVNTNIPDKMNFKGLKSIFFNAERQTEKIITRYSEAYVYVDEIERKLQTQKIKILKDITIFDTMYEKSLEYFKTISLYIIAGEKKIEELKSVDLSELPKVSEEITDKNNTYKSDDIINRFEKRIFNLKTLRTILVRIAIQIKLIKNSDSELVKEIQTSLKNNIPIWKKEIVITLGLDNSQNTVKIPESVIDTTDEIVNQEPIENTENSKKTIINVETLKQSNKNIIEIVNNVLDTYENTRTKRTTAERELLNIKQLLKDEIKMEKN